MTSYDILTLVITGVVLVLAYIKWKHQYWKRKGVPYIEPSIPFGNVKDIVLRQSSLGDVFRKLYDVIRREGHKHAGAYFIVNPVYMPIDIELVKNILARDFQHFSDRGLFYYNEKDDPLTAHLFALDTVKWRAMRTKLTPTFTSGKMKLMYPLIVESTKPMLSTMEEYAKSGDVIDIKDVLGNFTTDVIGTCAFGLECNSFADSESEFRKFGKKVFTSTRFRNLRGLFAATFKRLARFLHVRVLDKDVSDFFLGMSMSTIEYRKKNNILRNDFVNLLININKDGELLSPAEMAAQMFVFFLAGFETSATTMSYALYELSKYPEIQKKVREEVKKVLEQHGGNLTYEAVYDMKYLGAVVDETLRLHPPVGVLNRECTSAYHIPDTDVTIEAGTAVFISVYGIHYDPNHFSQPEQFEPERFLGENKDKIKPFTYLPFGDGPRNCIGLRFGIMQTMVGLAVLLPRYKFTGNAKTQEPLVNDPNMFLSSVKGGLWLNLEKVDV